MNVTGLFIRRPVMTTLVMLGVLIFGMIAYTKLPVSDLPNVDYPTINVNATLPGASPETMAAAVATPLEKQFSTIAGIDNMTSSSVLGSTSITVQFNLDRNINAAAQDIEAGISQALVNLPTGIIPPSFFRQNPAAAPVLFMALTSKSRAAVRARRDRRDHDRAAHLDGRRGVAGHGLGAAEVRGPDRAQSAGAGVARDRRRPGDRRGQRPERQSADRHHVGAESGHHRAGDRQPRTTPRSSGRSSSPTTTRRRCFLRDIATVTDDVQNNRTAAWFNNQRSIMLAVMRQPGTNTVEVTERRAEDPR